MSSPEDVRFNVDVAIDLGPCLILSAIGLVSNMVSAITFWKMGFRESSNTSLLVIAVVDCVRCCASLFYRGYGFAGLSDRVLEINWTRIFFYCNANVQNFGALLINVTVMYLTIERCLCLWLPLKVKSLVTSRVTTITLTCLIGAVFTSLSPTFGTFMYVWVWDNELNQSIVEFTPTDLYVPNEPLVIGMNVVYMFWSFCPFVHTFVATVLIIIKLQQHGEFRSKNFNVPGSNFVHKVNSRPSPCFAPGKNPTPPQVTLSMRETRLVKMLLLVTLVYFIHILPKLCLTLATTVEPEFNFYGQLNNIFLIGYLIMSLIELMVANAHTFIYLAMSSQFRRVFVRTFRTRRCCTDQCIGNRDFK